MEKRYHRYGQRRIALGLAHAHVLRGCEIEHGSGGHERALASDEAW
jgi:hypothetical protein